MQNASRPTKTFTTPNGHEVVFYTYLTAGDEREVNKVFLRAMKVRRPVGSDATAVAAEARKAQESMEITGDQLYEAQEVAVRRLLVSVDDCSPEDSYDRLMELQPVDANAVVAEIERITTEEQQEKKGDTPPPSTPTSQPEDTQMT